VNVDGCRIKTVEVLGRNQSHQDQPTWKGLADNGYNNNSDMRGGRWPTNLILGHLPECKRVGSKKVKGSNGIRGSGGNKYANGKGFANTLSETGQEVGYADPDGLETVADWDCVEGCPVRLISEQSGHSVTRPQRCKTTGASGSFNASDGEAFTLLNDEGTAARFFKQIEPDPFFYCSKASPPERGGSTHPTMKPLKLMRYLVKLVTPPGGMVLDPFAGSGTTLVAAKKEGFSAIGIEIAPEYYEIALARIDLAQKSLDFFGGDDER
jgi:hypothetical protein